MRKQAKRKAGGKKKPKDKAPSPKKKPSSSTAKKLAEASVAIEQTGREFGSHTRAKQIKNDALAALKQRREVKRMKKEPLQVDDVFGADDDDDDADDRDSDARSVESKSSASESDDRSESSAR